MADISSLTYLNQYTHGELAEFTHEQMSNLTPGSLPMTFLEDYTHEELTAYTHGQLSDMRTGTSATTAGLKISTKALKSMHASVPVATGINISTKALKSMGAGVYVSEELSLQTHSGKSGFEDASISAGIITLLFSNKSISMPIHIPSRIRQGVLGRAGFFSNIDMSLSVSEEIESSKLAGEAISASIKPASQVLGKMGAFSNIDMEHPLTPTITTSRVSSGVVGISSRVRKSIAALTGRRAEVPISVRLSLQVKHKPKEAHAKASIPIKGTVAVLGKKASSLLPLQAPIGVGELIEGIKHSRASLAVSHKTSNDLSYSPARGLAYPLVIACGHNQEVGAHANKTNLHAISLSSGARIFITESGSIHGIVGISQRVHQDISGSAGRKALVCITDGVKGYVEGAKEVEQSVSINNKPSFNALAGKQISADVSITHFLNIKAGHKSDIGTGRKIKRTAIKSDKTNLSYLSHEYLSRYTYLGLENMAHEEIGKADFTINPVGKAVHNLTIRRITTKTKTTNISYISYEYLSELTYLEMGETTHGDIGKVELTIAPIGKATQSLVVKRITTKTKTTNISFISHEYLSDFTNEQLESITYGEVGKADYVVTPTARAIHDKTRAKIVIKNTFHPLSLFTHEELSQFTHEELEGYVHLRLRPKKVIKIG